MLSTITGKLHAPKSHERVPPTLSLKRELQRFESQREQPKFGRDFPEPAFSELGIYLPACWLDFDGHETQLVFERVKPEWIERADAFKPA